MSSELTKTTLLNLIKHMVKVAKDDAHRTKNHIQNETEYITGRLMNQVSSFRVDLDKFGKFNYANMTGLYALCID